MLHVDILTAYLICGFSSLVGAVMLYVVGGSEPRQRSAMRSCALAFLVLFIALLPAGSGPHVVHPFIQWWLTAGALLGVSQLARGLGQFQGRPVGPRASAVLVIGAVSLPAVGLLQGPVGLAVAFTIGLAFVCSLMSWVTRGLLLRARDGAERALGWSLACVAAAGWARVAFTLAYDGPPVAHMMYVPAPIGQVIASFYAVIPMVVATLMLNLVNSRLRQQLRSRALTDELTGAMTRRALRELAPGLIQAELAAQRDVAVLMLDLDRFKAINDSHGHATGDAVLQIAAAALQAHMRPDGLLSRYGGEEFVAVVPVDGPQVARRVAERLRVAIAEVDWRARLALPEGVTVSVGVAIAGPVEDFDTVLRRADEALYRAKREGRNQCQFSLMIA